MSSPGRLVTVSLSCALGLAVVLGGCAADDTADLEDRVRELEDENTALREQIADLEAGETVPAATEPDGGPSSTPTPDSGTPDSGTPDSGPPDSGPPDDSVDPTTSTSGTVDVTTTTAPAALPGTQADPHDAGVEFRAGDWTLQVVGFEGNADPTVVSLSPDNPPPAPGNVYLRFRLRATYNGEGGGDPSRIRVNLLSPTGATVGPAEVCCEPQRVALEDQPETFPGGVIEGWLYYEVLAADLFEGSFVAFQPDADQAGLPGGVVFFAIN